VFCRSTSAISAQLLMRDNVPSLLTTRGPMWSSLTVLPPVDMSIDVVGVASDGAGRGSGVDCSLLSFCGVSVFFEVAAFVLWELVASGEFEDDMLRTCEIWEDRNTCRRRACRRWVFGKLRMDFMDGLRFQC
jgi:hypothetical protein